MVPCVYPHACACRRARWRRRRDDEEEEDGVGGGAGTRGAALRARAVVGGARLQGARTRRGDGEKHRVLLPATASRAAPQSSSGHIALPKLAAKFTEAHPVHASEDGVYDRRQDLCSSILPSVRCCKQACPAFGSAPARVTRPRAPGS
eukprot:scaffold1124_cov361-Prasinococcus_capsulatus_cf.AAC.16